MRRYVAGLFAVAVIVLGLVFGGGVASANTALDAGLIEAIRAGDVGQVRVAVSRGADVTAAEADGTTPLHWAAHADRLDVVIMLRG